MADFIKYQDLFDRDGMLRAINDLIAANKEYGDSSIATNKAISESVDELKGNLVSYKNELASLNAAQKSNQDRVGQLKDEVNQTSTAIKSHNTILAQNQVVLNSNAAVIDQLRGRIATLTAEYDKLDLTQKNDVKRKKEIEREMINNTRSLNGLITVTTQATKANMVIAGSYNAQSKELADLKNQLKAMPNAYDQNTGALNKQNKAAVELTEKITRADTALKKMDATMGVYTRLAQTVFFINFFCSSVAILNKVTNSILIERSVVKGQFRIGSTHFAAYFTSGRHTTPEGMRHSSCLVLVPMAG